MPAKNSDTTPYWSTSATFPQFAKLAEDVVADVVVVGGGMTGLTAAYLLAKAGKQVVVLERDRCAGTDTGHTSAHLTMVTDTRLTELVEAIRAQPRASGLGRGAGRHRDDRRGDSRAHDRRRLRVGRRIPACAARRRRCGRAGGATARRRPTLARDLGFDAEYVEAVPLVDRPGIRFRRSGPHSPASLPGGRREGVRGSRRPDPRALGGRRVLRRAARGEGQRPYRDAARTSSSPRTIRWSGSAASRAPRSFRRSSRCTPAT